MTDLAADVRPFDICGPLPTGVTVLEASAGTGKTYTIAGLAARYVAEGTPLERLLLVTFTRMATGELRERVRDRLVSTEHGLVRVLAGAPAGDADEIVALLADGARADVEERCRRLARAIADFDAATITTTHGFCQEVLAGLGTAGDVDSDTVLVEEVDDLLTEVVDDLYIRRFHRSSAPPFGRDEALTIAKVAVANPGAGLEPRAAADNTIAAMRVRLAEAVRHELEARKRHLGVMTYDDLLTRLDDTLTDPVAGPAAAARLRERYGVVLIDEFQDTDPVQWNILQRAFAGSQVKLVLIGDPKQAIYAFRGADVYAYLDAAKAAANRATLAVNWRTDQRLIDAYDLLFADARLGHEGIGYRRVRAAHPNAAPRLRGTPVDASLRVRIARRSDPAVAVTPRGFASNAPARLYVARDLAADVVSLLDSAATIEIRGAAGAAGDSERVSPGHLAVLVRTHRQAALIRQALDEVGVPAVVNGAGSVFATDVARDWLKLLEAIERPASSVRARAAALTPFLGWSAERLAAAGDEDLEDLHRRLLLWARVLRDHGVAAFQENLTVTEGLPQRMLRFQDGERALTDVRHIGQLLHAAATAEQLGAPALTAWLRRRVGAVAQETGDEERSRRLESDADAVQILTIHRSKGLEFPIVYYPYLWESGHIPRRDHPVVFHDADNQDARTVDVGLEGPDFLGHHRQQERELRGEDLRLVYVALTRARHQAVVWWAGSFDSRNAPLTRLLFSRDDQGNVAPAGTRTPTDAEVAERLAALAAQRPGTLSVEPAALPSVPVRWSAPSTPVRELEPARFDRRIDTRWMRTSYSGITAAAHEAWVGSEHESRVIDDEQLADGAAPLPAAGDSAGESEPGSAGVVSPWSDIPSNVHVGTFVHGVLETADFAAPDLRAELGDHVGARSDGRPVPIGSQAVLVDALAAAIETPLGPLLSGRRLRDLPRRDRLDELTFELPVAGRGAAAQVTLSALADVVARHVGDDGPVAGYAERLADPALRQELRGYLTGSIDLVARVPGGDGEPRFAIVDYKTNRLGSRGEPLLVGHYAPSALATEMQRAHYVLQGLLYSVALHRYLRWRLPGYDADRHLAGIAYLFLRGMAGVETPALGGTPYGVFAWRPPAGLVVELSDVLDHGGAG